jgi:uncharacterized protein YkwD
VIGHAPPPPSPCPAIRQGVRARINDVRAHHGLDAFAERPVLHLSAQEWANTRPKTNGDFVARMRAAGETLPDLGEVLAWGYQTPTAIVKAWMASPSHRRVILEPHSFLQYDGAGCLATSGRNSPFVVVDFSGR